MAPKAPDDTSIAVLAFAVWAGLLAGLLDAASFGYWGLLRLTHPFYSLHHWWMAPAANLLVYALLGLGATIWRPDSRLVCGGLVFVALYFGLRGGGESWFNHPAAATRLNAALLAMGMAVQISLFVVSHPSVVRFLRRSMLPLGTAVATASALGCLAPTLMERLRPVPTSPSHAPNVVLITMDTVRAANVSLCGYGKPTTPWLEKLAKTGVCFHHAFAPAPWTLPSHASILTGHAPSELFSRYDQSFSTSFSTLAEALSSHGYNTAGFVANMANCNSLFGFGRGFTRYEDVPVTPRETIMSSSLCSVAADLVWFGAMRYPKSVNDLNRSFLAWQQDHPNRPFFAFINYMEAHPPIFPTLCPQPLSPQEWGSLSTPQQQSAALQAYDAAIHYLDDKIHSLTEALKARGLLDNTIIIVTSDHGEHFGDHHLVSHGNSLYVQLLQVPLLISYPAGAVPQDITVSEPVSLLRIPATVMALCGLENPFPGVSLLGECQDEPLAENSVGHRMRALICGQFHYIAEYDDFECQKILHEELYDLNSDPLETQDLSGVASHRGNLEQCRSHLAARARSLHLRNR